MLPIETLTEAHRLISEGHGVKTLMSSIGLRETRARHLYRAIAMKGPRGQKIDYDRVRLMWDRGATVEAIASRCGCTVSGVHSVARRMGLPKRKPGRKGRLDTELLAKLWAEGVPVAEIAKRLGFSAGGIKGARFRLGLPPRTSQNEGAAA